MNIFYLDTNPYIAATYHCDKHVVKMILETAQLLSTAHWKLGGAGPYKLTHENHPSAVWVRESSGHYWWLLQLLTGLGNEYQYRYGKIHKTIADHKGYLVGYPRDLPRAGWLRDPPQAMPDECKRDDTVDAYRHYYTTEKASLLQYTKRPRPDWIQSNDVR